MKQFILLISLIALVCTEKLNLELGLDVNSTLRCVYSSISKVFSCRGPSLVVECDAFSNFTALGSNMFHSFGIASLPPDFDYTDLNSVKYLLYPKSQNNQTYFNYSVQIDGQPYDYYMYYGENFSNYGIRVSNLECFRKFLDIFRSSNQTFIGFVESSFLVKPTVSFIGTIAIVDDDDLKGESDIVNLIVKN